MAIRAVIVEDEQHSRERLAKLLAAFPDIEIAATAADGHAAIRTINELKPDLVFLDIQLPECSGFEVLSQLVERPAIIFVTAYDQYALRAFEENALDYLLKPISDARLAKAVQRVRTERRRIDDALLETLRAAVVRPSYPERLAVRQGNAILLVPVAEIHWLTAEDRYIVLRTAEQEYLFDGTLRELDTQLDPARFCRIHRSVIVAQDKIAKIVRSLGGRYAVKLTDKKNTSLPIGRAYLQQVRERFRF